MSTDLEPQILEKIKATMLSDKVKDIILFGSRAKGGAKNGSDIDIAIVSDDLSFKEICGLAVKIDDFNLPYKVDIIDYNNITNQELKNHIDRVGVHIK